MGKVKGEKSLKKHGLKAMLEQFQEHTANPQIYLTPQTQKVDKIKGLVKDIYDYSTSIGLPTNGKKPSYLQQLVTEAMVEEQIWQQMELKNEHILSQELENISKLLVVNDSRLQLKFGTEQDDANQSEEADNSYNMSAMDDDENEEDDDDSVDYEEEEEEDDVDDDQKMNSKKKKSSEKTKRSVVDDKFFKLDDMARFLDEEDERERRKQDGVAERNPLIEIDYFDENAGGDDDEADDSGEDIKYSDFFDDDNNDGDDDDDDDDDVDDEDDEDDDDDDDKDEEEENSDENIEESGEEEAGESDREQTGASSKNKNDETGNKEEETEDEMEQNRRLRYEIYQPTEAFIPSTNKVMQSKGTKTGSSADDGGNMSTDNKSSYEQQQQNLHQKIEKMEAQLLQEKPWQLKGEVSANSRPQNSLLDQYLEFDSTVRPVQVATEESTMKLEDIIRQRIKNKAFDDVERKVRPPDNPREYRKQLVLDGEKSKESLAQIYEKDYLKQLEKSNPNAEQAEEEEPKEHKQIRGMMKTVLAQLDALSSFHYTPRPAVPDLKILTNTPAINMEEVAPVATSDAMLLAPEEIRNRPKGDVMSKDERTKEDKHRERRLKKRFQRDKFRKQEEKEKKLLEKSGKLQSKKTQAALLKKVSKAKNVHRMKETSGGPGKSSSAFFAQLQDEVRNKVKSKAVAAKKAKAVNAVPAASVKL